MRAEKEDTLACLNFNAELQALEGTSGDLVDNTKLGGSVDLP